MYRADNPFIVEDLEKKMVFLSGPRQVGKTTLAQSLSATWPKLQYFNYDSDEHRSLVLKKQWDRSSDLVVFDEIHKHPKWKTFLKGVYDVEKRPPRILVTGSARLDVFRRGGDSLAGRYFLHRLHPFSVAELKSQFSPEEILEKLMRFGGFPEPFLSGSEEESKKWRKSHLERIVREDIQDLDPVDNIRSLLLLIDLLRERVGSLISYASLAGDLQVSPHTVRRWIEVLERMYVVFVVMPHHRNLARALLKSSKVYFYDTGAVRGDDGARLENAVAACLKKRVDFLEDTRGEDMRLHFLRDKEKREIDFVILKDNKVDSLIEVKWADARLSPSLAYYHRLLRPRESVQLVHALPESRTIDGIPVVPAARWLGELEA